MHRSAPPLAQVEGGGGLMAQHAPVSLAGRSGWEPA